MSTAPRVVISPKDFDGFIFDMDGVVTQTASLHAAAWKHMFDEYLQRRQSRGEGPYSPFDVIVDYLPYVDGKPRVDGVVSFLASRGITLPLGVPDDPPDSETVYGLGNRKNQYFHQLLGEQGVHVYQSTVELIRQLKRAGLRIGIFSASRNAGDILKAGGVLGLFEAKVDGSDASSLGLPGKPDPAMLLEVARRLGLSPARTAVAEDAIAGVQAGKAGQFRLVIGVNRTGEDGSLKAAGADVEVHDLSEVSVSSN
ncbi:MAG TPA: beta-phosphoglucomutase family hydrolase [Dehalococcoidia bacterium]|nr:beta-phosphoglucomutase family hydrolase [Dehalococcoidia bacterium]